MKCIWIEGVNERQIIRGKPWKRTAAPSIKSQLADMCFRQNLMLQICKMHRSSHYKRPDHVAYGVYGFKSLIIWHASTSPIQFICQLYEPSCIMLWITRSLPKQEATNIVHLLLSVCLHACRLCMFWISLNNFPQGP